MKPKVLVVDDDADLLQLLTVRLRTSGYEVDNACSAEQALAKLTLFHPQLVITDLKMSGMDGMTLFDNIQDHDPALPVIVLTAHGTIPDAVEATQRGVFSYLTKPFDRAQLLETIARALRLSSNAEPDTGVDDDDHWCPDIISRSAVMKTLLQQARRVAESDISVLIQSESGTGKELLAQAIHRVSGRCDKPFMAINCASIPEALLESELFGHAKGAFTGATQAQDGLFQAANGGTLFLDEIGDMPSAFQAKLLRVLEQREVRPLGSQKTSPVDVRVLSATHQDLTVQMGVDQFRDDLYYRLSGVILELPPLSERREDIPLMVHHFKERACQQYDKKVRGYSPAAMELLITAPWPGNVRQLLNIVEQTVVLANTQIISENLVERALRDKPEKLLSLSRAREKFELNYLTRLLQLTEGNVSQAARLAERNRTEFYKLLQRYQLEPAQFRSRYD